MGAVGPADTLRGAVWTGPRQVLGDQSLMLLVFSTTCKVILCYQGTEGLDSPRGDSRMHHGGRHPMATSGPIGDCPRPVYY